jgi:Leucine-rich repeat (LRR) protein
MKIHCIVPSDIYFPADNATHVVFMPNEFKELPILPDMPSGIRVIDCGHNNITIISEFPRRMQKLKCNDNLLIEMADLPYDTRILRCYHNFFKKQIKLSPKITKFDFDKSIAELGVLPELPPKLEMLVCFMNKITDIHTLPESLRILNCCYNLIEELPSILPMKLEIVDCSENKLRELPDIPENVFKFRCDCNEIKYISKHNFHRLKDMFYVSKRYVSIFGNPFYENNTINRCIQSFFKT